MKGYKIPLIILGAAWVTILLAIRAIVHHALWWSLADCVASAAILGMAWALIPARTSVSGKE